MHLEAAARRDADAKRRRSSAKRRRKAAGLRERSDHSFDVTDSLRDDALPSLRSKAMNPNQATAPNQRTFSLNSEEFYHAVTPPPDPWGWGPRLPREPRVRDPEVIVEAKSRLAKRIIDFR